MVLKRKAVGIVSGKRSKALVSKHVEEDEEHTEEADTEPAVRKRPAAKSTVDEKDAMVDANEDEEGNPEEEEQEEEQEEEVDEEQKLKEQEEHEVSRRTKELKGKSAAELRELVAALGLEAQNKAEMIQQVVAHEAKVRADSREHEAKLRAVVVNKKAELEALSVSELCKLCAAGGIKGVMSKTDRVQQLLKQWQEEDGVDKALRQMAHEARKKSLEAMDKSALHHLCEQAGLDPFVTEVMVDRISKREHEMGCYLRPVPSQEEKAKVTNEADAGSGEDVVAALLATEKSRKVDKELKRQQDEAVASRRKELKAMTIDDLKKALEKRGVEAAGKKEELVEKLFDLRQREDAVAARKSTLKALSMQELKDQLVRKGLEVAGSKERMAEALLAHEDKLREELRSFDAKAAEVLARKKEELAGKTAAELKELCESNGLKVGGGKEEKIERLLEEAQKTGEINTGVSLLIRRARREALGALSRAELVALCEKLGADPLVKEVMVERIMTREAEFGAIEGDVAPPAAKKARTSKK